jgi:hypothetical protein
MKEEIVFLNERELSLERFNPGLYYIRIGTTIHKIVKE